MIKKKIIFIIVFVVVLCAVLGFLIASILSTNTPPYNPNTNDESTSEENDLGYIFRLDCKDVTIFEGTDYLFRSFILTNDISNWKLSATTTSSKVQIDIENFKIFGNECINDVQVEISAEPLFDVSKVEEFKDIEIPIKNSFNVNVLPSNINLQYSVQSLGINEFDVKITSSNYSLEKDALKILNAEDFTISNITLNNDNELILKSLNIKNSLSKVLSLKYEVIDDNGVSKTKNLNITLSQNENFIEYSWIVPSQFNNVLYLTKNNKFDEDYPNKAQLSISNNFDLEQTKSEFVLKSGKQSGLHIDGLEITAKEVGEYVINLVIEQKIIDTINIQVKNIDVDGIQLTNLEINCLVDEQVTLIPDIVNVVANELAIYQVGFEILNQNEYATIVNNIFVASRIGEYNIKVYAGDKEKTFKIIVKEPVVERFALLDENDNELNEIDISKENLILNPELSIKFKYLYSSYSKYSLLVSSNDDGFISGEVFEGGNLSIILNKNILQVGDCVNISIKTVTQKEEDAEFWNIKLNIIN